MKAWMTATRDLSWRKLNPGIRLVCHLFAPHHTSQCSSWLLPAPIVMSHMVCADDMELTETFADMEDESDDDGNSRSKKRRKRFRDAHDVVIYAMFMQKLNKDEAQAKALTNGQCCMDAAAQMTHGCHCLLRQ